ncbi:MAG TPA: hypothetical protein VGJ41_13920 [Nocardioides sp.]
MRATTAVSSSHRPVGPRRRSEVAMAVGTLGSQVCVYLLNILATHDLGPAKYGELATLLTVTVIMSIPALALQSWTARTVAQGGDARSILSTTAVLAVLSSAATVGAGVLMGPHIDTDPVPSAVTAALLVFPLVWLSAAQGFLQGSSRLVRFAVVLLLAGVARLLGGALGLWFGIGTWPVVWGIGLGTVLVAGIAWALALEHAPPHRAPAEWGPVLRIAAATGAVWALANVDILLARIALPAHASGLYAAGALITRAVQFAPQFVALSAFAQLTDPATSRRVLAVAAGKMSVMGLAATLFLVPVGPVVVPMVFGSEFAGVGHLAWLFAVLGTLLALNQLLVAQRVARHDEAIAGFVWLAAGSLCGVVLLLLGGSVVQVLVAGVTVNAVLAVGLAGRCVSRR